MRDVIDRETHITVPGSLDDPRFGDPPPGSAALRLRASTTGGSRLSVYRKWTAFRSR
jgi:hypothetical protein